jgi:hypothetical protein
MSLYKHVANKEEILDGIVELVVGEMEIPEEGTGWKEAMRRRAVSAREVLGRHSWAIGLLESRGLRGPVALRYVDAILGNLRAAGFSVEDAAHAFWILDSYVYGHVIQETSLEPRDADPTGVPPDPDAEDFPPAAYPHLAEVSEHAVRSGFDVDDEFAFGLELILDALGGDRGRP